MKLQATAFLFLLAFLFVFSRAPVYVHASSKDAKPAHAPIPEYPADKVKSLLKKIQAEKKLCAKPFGKYEQRPGVCRSTKLLLAMEGMLESYLEVQKRANSELLKQREIENKNAYLTVQAENLKDALRDLGSPTKVVSPKECFKSAFLRKLMVDEGVTENGSFLFQKRPVPGGEGVCWTNMRKKKESSFNLCNYPLAITIDTVGGSEKAPIHRHKEYLFALNGCDLLSVHVHDSGRGVPEKETYVAYDKCIDQWNKRTADAAMQPKEVALMEDTIGFCFREYLLPPRDSKTGRDNPMIRKPAAQSLVPLSRLMSD